MRTLVGVKWSVDEPKSLFCEIDLRFGEKENLVIPVTHSSIQSYVFDLENADAVSVHVRQCQGLTLQGVTMSNDLITNDLKAISILLNLESYPDMSIFRRIEIKQETNDYDNKITQYFQQLWKYVTTLIPIALLAALGQWLMRFLRYRSGWRGPYENYTVVFLRHSGNDDQITNALKSASLVDVANDSKDQNQCSHPSTKETYLEDLLENLDLVGVLGLIPSKNIGCGFE